MQKELRKLTNDYSRKIINLYDEFEKIETAMHRVKGDLKYWFQFFDKHFSNIKKQLLIFENDIQQFDDKYCITKNILMYGILYRKNNDLKYKTEEIILSTFLDLIYLKEILIYCSQKFKIIKQKSYLQSESLWEVKFLIDTSKLDNYTNIFKNYYLLCKNYIVDYNVIANQRKIEYDQMQELIKLRENRNVKLRKEAEEKQKEAEEYHSNYENNYLTFIESMQTVGIKIKLNNKVPERN